MIIAVLAALVVWVLLYAAARWGHRHRGWPDWHRDVLAAGLLGLACLGYFWRILLGDSYMPADGGDLIAFLWPTYRFAADTLRSGTWPLWNPHLYGGAPHGADIQAGFLYPVNLLLFLLVPNFGVKAMEGLSILHMWWAGLGMFVFVRGLRWDHEPGEPNQVGRAAALAAGLAFAFSDALWIHFGNLNYVAVASWLPWVMACFVRALETSSAGPRPGNRGVEEESGERKGRSWVVGLAWAAVGGLLLGVGTLAGHIQATLFIGLAALLYGLLWLYWEMREGGHAGHNAPELRGGTGWRSPLTRLLSSLAVLGLVAAFVAAPALLPALQLAPNTTRADWTYQEAVGFSLSPVQWIALLVPGFFGRGPQLHWGPWPRVEVGYLGVFPLILAALAILARRQRQVWTLAGLSAVAFVLALGIYSVPHGWLSLLPGVGLLRAPARFALLVDFGLAVLAGFGLHVLLRPLGEGENWRALTRLTDALRWGAKVLLAVVVPLTFAVLLVTQDKDPSVYIRIAVAAIAIMFFVAFFLSSLGLLAARKAGWGTTRSLAVAALVLIFLDLASTGAYFDISSEDPSSGFDHPEIASFLAQETDRFRIDARTDIDQLWQPNSALLYGLDDVWGIVNPSILAAYERYWEGMGSRSSPLYDFLNARYVIAGKDVELDWGKFELAFEGDPDLNIYRNRDVLPRAQVIHDATIINSADSAEAARDAVQAPGFDPSRAVVIEQGDAELLPSAAPAAGAEEVTWLEYGPNQLVLEVSTTAPGYLVLSEVWYPGWRAEVATDDASEPQPVLRANTAFRAVPLWEPGTYQVTLQYAPGGWSAGLILGSVALLALLGLGLWILRRGANG